MFNQPDAATDRPYPDRTERLPEAVEQVDAAWLTRLLQNKYPGVVVESMEVVKLINTHTTKLRLALELNQAGRDAGIPRHVCVKSNWSGKFRNVDISELEARFYYFVRDSLDIPAPVSYYADWDPDVGEGVVVMEDLALQNGEFGQSLQHTGIDKVARALEGLARLHGAWWGSPKLDEQKWLPTSMQTPVDSDQLEIMWEYAKINMADPKFRKVISKWVLDDPQRFVRAYKALNRFEQSQTGPRCIVHGDCHLGNSYLRANGERVWLDWQLVRKGRPWRDLTYFMVGSLTIEERRQCERALHKHYRDALVATGAQGVLDLDGIFEQYRRWIIYGQQAWIANMDEWGQNGLPMNERFFTAGDDLETLKALES
jgi:Ecdysteroid kinase-like family